MGALRASYYNFHLCVSVGASRHNTVEYSIELGLAVSYVNVDIASELAQEEQTSANGTFALRTRQREAISPGSRKRYRQAAESMSTGSRKYVDRQQEAM